MVNQGISTKSLRDYVAIILATASIIATAYASYTKNNTDVEHRLTAVETSHASDHDILIRVESKLDKLTEWAIGSK